MNQAVATASDRVPEAVDSSAQRGKAIAFYLPQFHPIPENDRWWGAGFTEWTNVVVAKPRFNGHYQPHLPGALGFYDLRLEESRLAQATLAAHYGIHGFCYYHYWFSGRRLLGRPLDEMRASGAPDLPFCLCWANQTWSRTWSGRGHDVLIEQEYSEADNREHIAWLVDVFSDSRYIRIDGRPVFLIYLPESIPDVARMVGDWKTYCIKHLSVEPFFCAVRTGYSTGTEEDMIASGFDAVVDFQPNRDNFPPASNRAGRVLSVVKKVAPENVYDVLRNSRMLACREINTVVDYPAYVDAYMKRRYSDRHLTFPCVFPSWDNSARRTAATIIQNNSPQMYQRWLDEALNRVSTYQADARLVFINAWNEWAEGCHLEPDDRNGFAFLEATRHAMHGGSIGP